jgi:RsiW-degrading membrane proteinase PrsW (M82 family)
MRWYQRVTTATNSTPKLLRLTLWIIGSGFIASFAIISVQQLNQKQPAADPGSTLIQQIIDPNLELLRSSYREIRPPATPAPRALAKWLRRLCHISATQATQDRIDLHPFAIPELIAHHSASPQQALLFEHYLNSAHPTHAPEQKAEALLALQNAAEINPPPPLANQLLAQYHVQHKQLEAAVTAFITEGQTFPDANAARAEAMHWAVDLKLTHTLPPMLADPQWRTDADPAVLYHAALLTQDLWLQWQSLLYLKWQSLPWFKLFLTLFSTALWYLILILLIRPRTRLSWFAGILPLSAGIISIWPTLSLISWQEQTLGLHPGTELLENLWYYIGGVGLREELSKLALCTPFIPWILRRGRPDSALIIGAFVGLGFALEENMDYYQSAGGSIVWGRFITANFIHASLTGIAFHGLIQIIRSRFNQLTEGITQILIAVIAHGLYDWVLLGHLSIQLELPFLHIFVIAFLANHFFTALHQHRSNGPQILPPTSIFVLGSATLISLLLISAAITQGTSAALADVAEGCLAVVPVAFIFWKHLAH